MENTDTFYERDAYWHNNRPLKAAKFCAKCGQVKLMAKFKRYLTPAEARSHGYSGEARVEVETASCNVCTPKRTKPLSQLTNAEIKRKLANGDVREFLGVSVLKQREQAASKELSAGGKKSGEIKRIKKWEPLLDAIRLEMEAVWQQQKYARTCLAAKGTNKERLENWRHHGRTQAYCDAYLEILKKVRGDFTLSNRKARYAPEHDRWQDYLTHYEKNVIRGVWEDIPNYARAMMRTPKAFELPPEKDETEAEVVEKQAPVAEAEAKPLPEGMPPMPIAVKATETQATPKEAAPKQTLPQQRPEGMPPMPIVPTAALMAEKKAKQERPAEHDEGNPDWLDDLTAGL